MLSGRFLAEIESVRLRKVADDQRTDRDFGTHVKKDAQSAEREAPLAEQIKSAQYRGVVRDRIREPSASKPDHSGNDHERSEEHTSELQSLMRISYAVFCLKKTNTILQHRKMKNR